jgi:hypothetical protein
MSLKQPNHNFYITHDETGSFVHIWAEHWQAKSRWRDKVQSLWIPGLGANADPAALLRATADILETPYADRPQPPR